MAGSAGASPGHDMAGSAGASPATAHFRKSWCPILARTCQGGVVPLQLHTMAIAHDASVAPAASAGVIFGSSATHPGLYCQGGIVPWKWRTQFWWARPTSAGQRAKLVLVFQDK